MSESLTINTLNQGHFTHTHTHTTTHTGYDGTRWWGVREVEPQEKNGKAPFRAPGGRESGWSFYPGPASRAGAESVIHFCTPRRVGLDTQ